MFAHEKGGYIPDIAVSWGLTAPEKLACSCPIYCLLRLKICIPKLLRNYSGKPEKVFLENDL